MNDKVLTVVEVANIQQLLEEWQFLFPQTPSYEELGSRNIGIWEMVDQDGAVVAFMELSASDWTNGIDWAIFPPDLTDLLGHGSIEPGEDIEERVLEMWDVVSHRPWFGGDNG